MLGQHEAGTREAKNVANLPGHGPRVEKVGSVLVATLGCAGRRGQALAPVLLEDVGCLICILAPRAPERCPAGQMRQAE
jgi:hypothetical protein